MLIYSEDTERYCRHSWRRDAWWPCRGEVQKPMKQRRHRKLDGPGEGACVPEAHDSKTTASARTHRRLPLLTAIIAKGCACACRCSTCLLVAARTRKSSALDLSFSELSLFHTRACTLANHAACTLPAPHGTQCSVVSGEVCLEVHNTKAVITAEGAV